MAANNLKPKAMEWTEDHDVLLLREIMVSDVFSFKKGSVSRGEKWEELSEKLNELKTPNFNLKDKRAVRDRWVLLQKKFKSRIRNEEAGSGISPPELTEKEVLIEELIEKEDSVSKADLVSSKQQEEKCKAEDMRQKALERYSETKKRKTSSPDDDEDETPKRQRKGARSEPLIDFMQEKSKHERELRQQELDIRRKEQEQSQQVMMTVLQQQQHMNQAFLSVMQKFIDKS